MGFYEAAESLLFSWKADGHLTDRDRLCEIFRPLVISNAKKFHTRHKDDLVSEGTVALLSVLDRVRTAKFVIQPQCIGFIQKTIYFRMLTFFQSDHVIPIPRSAYKLESIEDLFRRLTPVSLARASYTDDENGDDEDPGDADVIASPESIAEFLIADLVRGMRLDSINEEIFRLRLKGCSFREIATEVGITAQAVHLRHQKIQHAFIKATGLKPRKVLNGSTS